MHGGSNVAFGELVYEAGNVVAYRAALYALGHLAVEASLGLVDSLTESEAARSHWDALVVVVHLAKNIWSLYITYGGVDLV